MNAAADGNIDDYEMVTVPTAVAMGTVVSNGPCTLQYDTWHLVVARRLAEAMRGLASMASAGIGSLAGSNNVPMCDYVHQCNCVGLQPACSMVLRVGTVCLARLRRAVSPVGLGRLDTKLE